MPTGLVFNIQRYSIHDGPGIRTTVFLKGCPLRCWWCHNPESWTAEPELTTLEARCSRCGACQRACPKEVEELSPSETIQTPETCDQCGRCVQACPSGARRMVGRRMSVEALVEEVLRDRIFFDQSGGGVTFSGGEPLAQPHFLRDALEALQRRGVHATVDTCGLAEPDDLLAVAEHADLFLYDVKLIDPERHRQHTGCDNRRILENLDALARRHDNLWIRVPLVGGVNDDRENLDATRRLVGRYPSVRQVDLLPYHAAGMHKRSEGGGGGD